MVLCGTTDESSLSDPEGKLPTLARGQHEVQFVGTLPDGSETRSNVATVSLDCTVDSGENGGDTASDGGSGNGGAGPESEAGEVASEDGCSVTNSKSRALKAWFVLLALALAWRVRPVHRSRRAT